MRSMALVGVDGRREREVTISRGVAATLENERACTESLAGLRERKTFASPGKVLKVRGKYRGHEIVPIARCDALDTQPPYA